MKQVAKKLLSVVFALCLAVVGIVTTPTVEASAEATESFVKVTESAADWSGDYLIVYETGKVAFDGSLSTLDAVGNSVAVTIADGKIAATDALKKSAFTVAKSGSYYTIKAANNQYIGNDGTGNGLKASASTQYLNTISFNNGIEIKGKGGCKLQYYKASGSARFRYFGSAQEAITLYKLTVEGGAGTDTPTEDPTIRAAVNAVEPSMSLAYKYEKKNVTGVTDTLTLATTGVSGGSYVDWSGKTATSSAVYKGQSAGGNSSIQLRTTGSNSGVVTTTSGGKVKSITVTWNSNTASGRTLNVYGKNTAYTAATDLYNSSNQGTLLGTIVKGTSTVLEITGDYEYIGFRSNGSAMYLSEVQIVWETTGGEGTTKTVYAESDFRLRFGVEADVSDISTTYGIYVSTAKGEMYYDKNSKSWATEGNLVYLVVSLGDIINDMNKLGTKFTVQAYVTVDGITYKSESVKTYSVVDMVKAYYEEEEIEDVADLYNYLDANGAF